MSTSETTEGHAVVQRIVHLPTQGDFDLEHEANGGARDCHDCETADEACQAPRNVVCEADRQRE